LHSTYDSNSSSDLSSTSSVVDTSSDEDEIPMREVNIKKKIIAPKKEKLQKAKNKSIHGNTMKVIDKKHQASKKNKEPINLNKSENKKRIQNNQKTPFQPITSSYSGAVKGKQKSVVLFSDSILKNLRMTEFNDHVKNANVELKPFPGAQANQLTNRSRTVLEENKYDIGVVHVGINDLLNRRNLNDDVLNDICDDIMNMGFRCRNYNIGTIFISGIAYSTRIDVFFLNRLNKKLQEACLINGFFLLITERYVNKTYGKTVFI